MKIIKKVITMLITIVMLSTPTSTAHAQDLSQYYAMSAQLMQMAIIMQAQAAQLAGVYGAQAPIVAQPTAQAVVPAVDLQAQQAMAIQQAQAMAIAQAQAQQALLLAQTQAVQAPVPTPAIAPTVATPTPAVGSTGNADYFNTYDIPEQQQTDAKYVLNLNTHKFHDPTCGEVRKIKPENYQATNAAREEIVSSGYVPCGICTP